MNKRTGLRPKTKKAKTVKKSTDKKPAGRRRNRSPFADKLKALQSVWEVAKDSVDAGFTIPVPDAKYDCQLVEAKLFATKKGEMRCIWKVKVLSGDYTGSSFVFTNQFKTEQSLSFFLKNLSLFGYAPEESQPDTWEKSLKEITEAQPQVNLTVQTSGDFRNVFMNYQLTPEDMIDAGPAGAVDISEDAQDDADPVEESEWNEESDDDTDDADDAWGDEDDAEEEEPQAKLEIGSIVKVTKNGRTLEGEVQKIDEDAGLFWIKSEGRKKLAKVDSNDESFDIEIQKSEDEDEDDAWD